MPRRLKLTLAASLSALAAVGLQVVRPPAAHAQDVVVAAAGDIACDPEDRHFNNGEGRVRNCRQRDTANLVERIAPDAVLTLGDNQYEFGTLENFARSYDPTWGRFKAITYANPGDSHDFAGGGEWYQYFGERAGPEPYKPWSFDLGSWHVVSLNAACDDPNVGGCGPGSPQVEWLRENLARNAGRCTAAMMHEPLWSSASPRGGESSVREMVRVLHQAGADLILSGHEHAYERFGPQGPDGQADERGIVQMIVGTGGRNLQKFQEIQPNSAARWSDSFGVMRLVLRPGRYEWQFVPVDEVAFSDGGSRQCNNGGTGRMRIKLTVKPKRVRAGLDRGFLFRAMVVANGRRLPLGGAVVRFARQRGITNSRGYVRIRATHRKAALRRAWAYARGYSRGSAHVRILSRRR